MTKLASATAGLDPTGITEVTSAMESLTKKPETVKRKKKKIGRNAPCPCDSGKKFKKCCGNH